MKTKYYILNEGGFFDVISLNVRKSKAGILREIKIIDGANIFEDKDALAFKEIRFNDSDKSSTNIAQIRKFAKDLLKQTTEIEKVSTISHGKTLLETTFRTAITETVSSILGNSGVFFITYKDGHIKILGDNQDVDFKSSTELDNYLTNASEKYVLEQDITATNPGKALIKKDKEIVSVKLYNIIP